MRSQPYERKMIMNTPSLVRPVSFLLLAGALWLPALSAADAPLIADTYISAGAPATNFGSAASITIAPGNTGLVQFNLASIPPSSTVPVAYLKVYVNKVTAAGTLTFSPVLSAWTEAGVTSSTGPAVGASFASVPVTRRQYFRADRRHRAGERLARQPGYEFRNCNRRDRRHRGSAGYQGKYRHQPSGRSRCHGNRSSGR